MNDKPEALRLADVLEKKWLLWRQGDDMSDEFKAAAELRRLHAENETLKTTKHYEAPRGFVLNPDYLVPELQAERDALLAENRTLRGLLKECRKVVKADTILRKSLRHIELCKRISKAIDAARKDV